MQKIDINGNTPVGTMTLQADESLVVHAELGPVFDRDLERNIFINCAVRFDYSDEPYFGIAMCEVLPGSFIQAYHENKEKEKTTVKDVVDTTGTPFSEIFQIKYAEQICQLTEYVVASTMQEVQKLLPEHMDLLTYLMTNRQDDLIPSFMQDWDEEEPEATSVDIDWNIADDSDYTIIAKTAPVDFEDCDGPIILKTIINYDVNYPDEYLITDYILFTDEDGEFPGEDEENNWMVINESEELEEQFETRLVPLHGLAIQKLFEVAQEHNDALSTLVETLEEDGLISPSDEEDFEDDYDDEFDFTWDDEDDEDDVCWYEED